MCSTYCYHRVMRELTEIHLPYICYILKIFLTYFSELTGFCKAVFEALEHKPEWIKIFSDNGGYYHCSEMMAIVRNWHQWYNIDVRGWYFFEPGEAKSLVDSHHAAVRLF